MIIIYNPILPGKGFEAINIFGIIFIRKEVQATPQLLRHEKIHTAQIKELLFIFFYLFYFLEWLFKLFKYGRKAYYNISFEREAYQHDDDINYLSKRKHFSFLYYLRKK